MDANKVVDPNDPRYATTCDGHPTAEQMEESARRQRESTALSVWDVDAERELLIREAAEWAKRERSARSPGCATRVGCSLIKGTPTPTHIHSLAHGA